MKRPEKPGVDTTSIPVKRAAMALGHNLTGKGYDVPELKECSDEDTLDVLDMDKIVFRPEKPGVDTTSFPGEGNPNRSSAHGEAEADAEDSDADEFWECGECPVCHFCWGPVVAECYPGRVDLAKELAKQGHQETRLLLFAGLLQMVLGK